jgi:hypothetical protein
MAKALKITVQGVGDLTLTDHDFIAKGGEGSVYFQGSMGFKIYEDPTKMIPHGKIKELSVISHPNVIKPEQLITDTRGRVIGHTMKFVRNAIPLGQLFTKAYRTRNRITPDMMMGLVTKLQEMVAHIHSKRILIVDLNEYNFLASDRYDNLFGIDTNCYQTPSFPATAIMEHIRDRHCNGKWSEGTDWFSWGIVTCCMFTGIHPYKGGHPKFDATPADERLELRMKSNTSIFNPQARIPAVCYPITVVPPALRQWYIEVFEKGLRQAPPTDYAGVLKIVAVMREIVGSNLFEIKPFRSYDSNIVDVYTHNGNIVVVTEQSLYYNDRQYKIPNPKAKVGFTPKLSRPFAAWIESGQVKLWDVVGASPINMTCAGEEIVCYDGRVFIKNSTGILELNFVETSITIATAAKIGNVLDMPSATKVFDAVLFQSLLGKFYASIFPQKGQCYQIKMDELDNHRIVDAKYENNVLAVVGVDRKGKYNRFVFRFSPDYAQHDCKVFKDIQHTGLNFTVADQGACVFINEEEKVEVWSNIYNRGTIQVLDDPAIQGDMTLCHIGSKILFAKGNELSSITMRKP